MRNILKNTLWSTRTQIIDRNPSFIRQQRLLSIPIKQTHREIAHLYDKLLNQSSTPIACNFVSQIIDHWAKDSKKIAIYCRDQDSPYMETIRYHDIAVRSHQIGKYFESRGIKKGDTVALMLGQKPAWWFGLAALMRYGIAAVPCPRLLTSKDLIYRINDLGIRAIITGPESQEKIDSIRPDCPTLICTVTTGAANLQWDSLSDIFKLHPIISPPECITTTEDPCLYLYTSGTTGQPKAVQHNADYPFFHWPTGKRWLKATSEDLVYNASDTGWGFTVWTSTAVWAMGAKLLVTPTNQKFNSSRMLATLREEPVTIFCAAPTVLRMLVADENFERYHLPHLKRIVTVGEALDETVIQKFEARQIEVAVGFGQAETPLLIGRVDDQPHVSGTMGKPIDPYQISILDENLQPLLPENVGQIAVDLREGKKGGLMRRYANAPERTQKSFSPDGRYYLTGDWAKLCAGGLFIYQGRKDDLIKSRGYRIGPDEVEKAGMSHPAVRKIAVVGIRTQRDSPAITVKAFILLKPGHSETEDLIRDIQRHIQSKIEPYKYPRLVECLSLEEWMQYETTSGKIRRAGLREREELRLSNNRNDTSTPTSTLRP